MGCERLEDHSTFFCIQLDAQPHFKGETLRHKNVSIKSHFVSFSVFLFVFVFFCCIYSSSCFDATAWLLCHLRAQPLLLLIFESQTSNKRFQLKPCDMDNFMVVNPKDVCGNGSCNWTGSAFNRPACDYGLPILAWRQKKKKKRFQLEARLAEQCCQ